MRERRAICILLICSLLFLASFAFPKEGEKFKPKLSINLTGMCGLSTIGDINRCMNSVNNNERFDYWRENDPERVIGDIKELSNWIIDWQAELRIDVTPKIAIGIATSGSIHRKNESFLTYIYKGSFGDQITALTFEPNVEVSMPIRLGIYYVLPYGKKTNFFFNAGIGHYSGRMTEYLKYEVTDPSGGYSWITRYWETDPKFSLGFHGGVGIEYFFLKNLALVVELRGKYVKIRNFKARVERESSDLMYIEEIGNLYYFTKWNPGIGARYADLEVWEVPPEGSIYDISDVRKAVLDLSGISLRVGIKIGLF